MKIDSININFKFSFCLLMGDSIQILKQIIKNPYEYNLPLLIIFNDVKQAQVSQDRLNKAKVIQIRNNFGIKSAGKFNQDDLNVNDMQDMFRMKRNIPFLR